MTTIAWDGRVLAADKRMTTNGATGVITKIQKIEVDDRSYLIGASGNMTICKALSEWFKGGRKDSDFPPAPKDGFGIKSRLLVIDDKKLIHLYNEHSKYPTLLENPFYAIGSGNGYAIAAMHCGKTAVEAIEIASLYDENTGNGIDTLMFAD